MSIGGGCSVTVSYILLHFPHVCVTNLVVARVSASLRYFYRSDDQPDRKYDMTSD